MTSPNGAQPPPKLDENPFSKIPMLFGKAQGGKPSYPEFSPISIAPKFDMVFVLGPATPAQLALEMINIAEEVSLRGYLVQGRGIKHEAPQLTVVGQVSDQHKAEMRLAFRAAINELEIELCYFELGKISAARQWVDQQNGPKILM